MNYETHELSVETWPDFERLFAPGTGWAFCACMLYQRGCHLDRRVYTNRDQMRVQNQMEKRALVQSGRAHGVLVYTGGEPVGWCQFGPVEELPLPGGNRLDGRIPPLHSGVRWRITCFVTAVRHRRRGAARVALRGAVRGIAERGGGLVEAYPTTRPQDGNWRHSGTLAMFEREGFTVHERPSAPYVVVRRTVAPSEPPATASHPSAGVGKMSGMDDATVRAMLVRHWEYAASDQDITHEIYHDDAVLEFPQSGERFVGVANFREWRRLYPATLAFEIREIRGRDDLWVAENLISYNGGPWNFTVNILEFRGDKVARESIYISEGWEAPEWRAQWRAAP